MQLKKLFKKILGKDTVDNSVNADNNTIKFEAVTPAQARSFVSQDTEDKVATLSINIPAGQYSNYDAIKQALIAQLATIVDPKNLDIVVLIKERQEALKNFVAFIKNSCGFPPSDDSSDQVKLVYMALTPTIASGEHAGRIDRAARYGNFKEHQAEIINFFDGSDDSKEHILSDQRENQKILMILSVIIALKNFALNKPLVYGKIVHDLASSKNSEQEKLAKILVVLAESPDTDLVLTYRGTVRSPEFKVIIENAIRQWYQACNLLCQ